MKTIKNILVCLTIIVAMISCKKAKNLEPIPSVSFVTSNTKVLSTAKEYNNLNFFPSIIPYETDVELTFRISAPAGFEQIDFKFYGDGSVWTGARPDSIVNGSGRQFDFQNVPFDWVNLNTIKGGFDSNTETVLKFRLPAIKQVTKFSFVVIDKNLIRSSYDYEIKTTELGYNFNKTATDLVLYSQNATLNDVLNVASDKKMFFNVYDLMASDTTELKNNKVFDFFFVNSFKEIKNPVTGDFERDSTGIPALYSTNILIEALKKDNLNEPFRKIGIMPIDSIHYKIRTLGDDNQPLKSKASGAINISLASFDFDNATIGDLMFEDMSQSKNKIDIKVGSTYILTANQIYRSIIKIKSIEDGSNNEKNVKLTFDVKTIYLRQ